MKPNIMFVLLDGSRWDRLHTSKEFQKLQKEGVLFNNVTTAIPYTFGAMNVIFTGLYGKENGVDAYYKMFKLKDSVDFLPEILQKNGYFTCCDTITDKVISSRGFDIHQSHDEYNDDLTKRHPDLIKKCFEEANGKPVFCFFQFSRIHTVTVSDILKKYEWDNKEYYARKEENLKTFDNVFAETCKYAEIIFQTIKKLGKSENTVFVFFTDHGTGIGERFGERNYGVYTFEETTRTFYLFTGPKIAKNKKSNDLLSTIDIFPTLLELCAIKYDNKTIGNSLANYLYGDFESKIERDVTFSETGGLQGPHPSPREPNVFCVKTPKYKLIYFQTPDKWKLFDLENDPNENNDIYDTGLDVENQLKVKLLKWINR